MSATTTLELDGAKFTVETSVLFHAWFEKHLGKPVASAIARPNPRPGERYLGSIIEPTGRLRHIFLLPGDQKNNWADGLEWANSLGGDLPDRVEQAMLYAYMPDEFKKEAYWSNTQHAGVSSLAWYQDFGDGFQGSDGKSAELRVRAVRRQPI